MGSFQIALSALKAASTAIGAVGNNLANINTTGFKRSDVSFSDLVGNISGDGEAQIGGGVGQTFTSRQFNQGVISPTNYPLDAAIEGSGFFVIQDAAGGNQYTRDGHFEASATGQLLASNGSVVQGWMANPATGKVDTTGAMTGITIPVGSILPPTPTTSFEVSANLDASATAGSSLTIPLTFIDATGGTHLFTLKAIKDTATPNTWNLELSTSDPTVQDADKLTDKLSVKTLTFANGALDPTTAASIDISSIAFTPASGISALGTIKWNLWSTPPSGTPPTGGVSGLTQYSQASAVSKIVENGSPAAALSGVRIADGGKVIGTYSNGVEVEVGRIALAGIRNPDSLISIGGNAFRGGSDTLVLPANQAMAAGMGQIRGGALESSNVDIAREFTDLITFQRGYQANSRVITTIDQMTQETINLIR